MTLFHYRSFALMRLCASPFVAIRIQRATQILLNQLPRNEIFPSVLFFYFIEITDSLSFFSYLFLQLQLIFKFASFSNILRESTVTYSLVFYTWRRKIEMANFCLTEQSINLRKSLLLSFISLDFLREKLNSLNSPSFSFPPRLYYHRNGV